jgi:GNAT superfamily N-acetyltransferase
VREAEVDKRQEGSVELFIRPVRDEDVEALEELAVLAWAPVFASVRNVLGPEIDAILHPDWRQRQREEMRRCCSEMPGVIALVAEVDGAVAGFIAYELDHDTLRGVVDLLAVHPDYQNRGIGTELNRIAIERMREAGMRIAIVGTGGDPGHAPARRTYEKAGYTLFPIAHYYQAL